MRNVLETINAIVMTIFMVGNLAGMGLQLDLRSAVAALRDVRFLVMSLVAGFVISPALAYLLTLIIPMERPYAIGLILLGMVPIAPYMPLVVGKARGDLAYTAAIMLIGAIGTVIFMPLAVPIMVEGLSANPWSIAKPLLLMMILPLSIGLLIKNRSDRLASRLYPPLNLFTTIDTVVFVIVLTILNGKGMIGAVGSFAIGATILFVFLTLLVGYLLGGSKPEQRSVLSLGMCSRNIGAAAVPLAGATVDPNVMVMLVIGMFVTLGVSFPVAKWLGSRAPQGSASPSFEAADLKGVKQH